jgi:hypothetical protein
MSHSSDDDAASSKPSTARPPRKARHTGHAGRRRTQVRKLDVLDRLLLTPVKVTGPCKHRKLLAIEVILQQLAQKEIAGSKRALTLRQRYEAISASASSPRVEVRLIENDYTLALRGEDPERERGDGC